MRWARRGVTKRRTPRFSVGYGEIYASIKRFEPLDSLRFGSWVTEIVGLFALCRIRNANGTW